MTVRNGGFPGDYYRTNLATPDDGFDVGSGSPNTSGCSDSLKRKFTVISCPEDETFGVPRLVLPLSGLASSERKTLILRLRQELEQVRSFQTAIVPPRPVGVTSTPASKFPRAKNFGMSRCSTGPGKKVLPLSAAKPAPVTTSTMLLMKQCETLLKRLMSHQHAWLFNTPVDVVKHNIPDYFTIIKHPMDLGTVNSKLISGTYSSPSEFAADVRLTFCNAMTYNPPGNDVYIFADTLSKFFEVRWKSIEKKSSRTKSEPSNCGTHADKEIAVPEPFVKKKKMTAVNNDSFVKTARRIMADEDRVKLGRDLGSLTEFPAHIISFLRDHCSKEGGSGDDEIEIDINDLSHDALFQLRDLLDEFLLENQKKDSNGERCELELLHGSGPESSLIQHHDGNEMEDEDVDVGNYERPRSLIPPVGTEKDMALGNTRGLENVSGYPKATWLLSSSKGPERLDSESPLDGVTSTSPRIKSPVSKLNRMEDASKEKLCSVEGADRHQDGNSVQNEKQLPPEKRYRAALLKNRFADLILKAREKTFNQNEKRDPERLRREREELEMQKKKEKARLQAEAKEAEEARRKAEAEAAAEAAGEAKRRLERERKAARQALLEMEKSAEKNENSKFLKELEMLETVNREEHLTNITGEEEEGLGGLRFVGSNPLEQLGLFIKHVADEYEDEDASREVEEGEID